jgi:hypothetical protein
MTGVIGASTARKVLHIARQFRSRIGALLASALCAFGLVHCLAPSTGAGQTHEAVTYRDLVNADGDSDPEIVRVRGDAVRNRLWVLTVENVYVYDTAERILLRRFRLPDWSVADFQYALAPDLVLDSRGRAFVSNNVEPRLLEIDPESFETKEHHVRLVSRTHLETGFGALQFRPDGALVARSTLGESTFSIDLANGEARELPSSREAPPSVAGTAAPAAYANAIRSEPPTISAPPTATCQEMASPRKTALRTIAKATLSLSIGATDETGPSCSAR